MQYIIMDQYVRRRENHPLISFPKLKGQTAYKPYKYIDEVKQNPTPLKRPRQKKQFHFPLRDKPEREAAPPPAAVVKKEPEPAAPPAFKRPFWDSPAPVCVLGAVAFFSALILAFQSSPVTALPPGEEPAAAMRENLASYAGIAAPEPAVTEAPAEGTPAAGADIPLDLMESFKWESYRVAKGDTVSKIAAARSVSMDAVIASNGIANVRRLREGQTLRIPNMDGIPYTVKRGDTLAKISAAMGAPLAAILDANDLQSDTLSAAQVLFIPGARMPKEELKLALGELFIYPIRGRMTSPYGWRNDPISGVRRYHAALDLASPTGTAVKAAMDGRIATVGYNSVYGNYIIISHSRGFQTLYGHLSATSVKQGAYVNQGGKIGAVGSTGYSTGPHLHFAVYKNGKAVNPLEYLNP
jgi:murein DD-endopeptidase MepM/ murein hydrolase activator NlpD